MQPAEFTIAISPPTMVAHATALDAVAAEVETARAAAEQVRLDSGAYGLVCAFVPAILNGLSDGLMAGLSGAAASLRDTGADLQAVAQGFTTTNAGAQSLIGADE